MVFQNVYLFHDTIRNNILFGAPNATEEEMIAAAKAARCHDFIMALPDGYDTLIGEGGSTLSGGEKQRISIARAILKNAPIVIFLTSLKTVEQSRAKQQKSKENIMKLTEELLNKMEQKKELYGDGIIMPDGDYRLIQDGHLKTLMSLLPYSENEIWKMIPDDDSALFWLVEKTNCVLTDVNSTIGMKMTPAQQKTYKALSSRGIISDEYYDLTRQREKVKAARANA